MAKKETGANMDAMMANMGSFGGPEPAEDLWDKCTHFGNHTLFNKICNLAHKRDTTQGELIQEIFLEYAASHKIDLDEIEQRPPMTTRKKRPRKR